MIASPMNSGDEILVVCPEPESAKRSVDALLGAGIPANDIVVLSSEPLEHRGIPSPQKTLMPWLVVLGALAGGSAGFLLSSLTQKSYAVHTGGMQVVTLWTDGIITYELTMLGAILTTGLVFLLTGLAGGRGRFQAAREVAEGKVVVGVASLPASLREKLTESLKAFGVVKQGRNPSPDVSG